MMASTIGAANSFTAIPSATPIGPIALKIERNRIISPLDSPDFKNATRSAIDSAGFGRERKTKQKKEEEPREKKNVRFLFGGCQ